jgi:2-amino-4-hydroxy-6-hydroxymethyldihydropteridine diphosphokinase
MRVFVGLGSNVGDRLGYLRAAVSSLRATDDVEVVAASTVYETEPAGPEQPDFLNAVVELDTDLAAEELLRICKRVEADLGRVPRERWGPREIDLDLLVYGDRRVETDDLVVPHPQLSARTFVLVPLEELAPALDVPGVGDTSSLLARLGRAGVRQFGPKELLLDEGG